MTKQTVLAVLVCLVFGLTACGPNEAVPAPEAEPAAGQPLAADSAESTATPTEETADANADALPAEQSADTAAEIAEEPGAERTDDASGADTSAADESMDAAAAADTAAEPAVERPAWQQLPLTNARTGETFTLADFADKTVFVEPMATWCTNCRQQLNNVRAARGQLNSDDVVFVALSVETNISAEQLAQYADNADFPWLFAVATPDLLNELVANFGRTITNPPSTPHFIIRGDGSTTDLVTGIESPDQLISQISAAGG